MKKFTNIIKISWVFLFSAFIIFEVYILANASKIAEFSDETNEAYEEAELAEIEIPAIPLANLVIEDIDEPEPANQITQNEPKTEVLIEATEIETTIEMAIETTVETTIEIATETTAEPPIENPIAEPKELAVKNVPILMYHTSSEQDLGGLPELYVKPSEFEKQLRYLIENGFTLCTFEDYYRLDEIAKPVFITFDDGYRENYTEIFPILKKYNVKMTIFLLFNNIEAENFTVDMIKEMSDSGLVKFESHTLSHMDLSVISSNDVLLASEIGKSKSKIEEITGKTVIAFAYPAGKFNESVKAKAKEYYMFGLRADLGMHRTDFDLFEIRRIRINRSASLADFINYVG
ncbi:MAG: polysaccharide deacetylase family protein [Oscillospiraceae bacterium]|nr:polysaccharide deacetylase family protein [Oscillospiraceae bacterium]